MNTTTLKKPFSYIPLAGFIIMLLIVATSHKPLFYDEPYYYIANLNFLHKYGLSHEFLMKMHGPAGPTYAVVHWLLEPLTRGNVTAIRLVNIIFLLGVIAVVNRIIKLLYPSGPKMGILIMLAPMTYVVAGLALTEMPAMFFFTVALAIFFSALKKEKNTIASFVVMAIAGLFMGCAIVGRQPYLLLAIVIPAFAYNFRNKKMLIATFFIFSMILPAIVFSAWKGLIPPFDTAAYQLPNAAQSTPQNIQISSEDTAGLHVSQKFINSYTDASKHTKSYVIEYFFLCLAYFALVTLIIEPRYFIKPSKKILLGFAVACILLIALNIYGGYVSYLPARSVFTKLFSIQNEPIIALIFGGLLCCFSGYYLLTLIIRAWENRNDVMQIFGVLSILAIAFVCMKNTYQFSSRYPAQALSVILVMLAPYYSDKNLLPLRYLAGVGLGLMSLVSYFYMT